MARDRPESTSPCLGHALDQSGWDFAIRRVQWAEIGDDLWRNERARRSGLHQDCSFGELTEDAPRNPGKVAGTVSGQSGDTAPVLAAHPRDTEAEHRVLRELPLQHAD